MTHLHNVLRDLPGGSRAITMLDRFCNLRIVRWWLDENASSGRELSAFTTLATALIVAWMLSQVAKHHHTRTAGVSDILQIAGVLIGGPIVVARLLPDNVATPRGKARIAIANALRWPFRHRRLFRTVSATAFVFALAIAFTFHSVIATTVLIIISAIAFMLAWIGFLLPRRYTAYIDPTTGKVVGYISAGRHPRAPALSAALAAACFGVAYTIQLFALYSIYPW